MKANDLIALALEESSGHISRAMNDLSPADLA